MTKIMRAYQVYEHNKPTPKGVDKTRLGWCVRATIQANSGKEAAIKYLKAPVKRSSWKDVLNGDREVVSVFRVGGNYSHWKKGAK